MRFGAASITISLISQVVALEEFVGQNDIIKSINCLKDHGIEADYLMEGRQLMLVPVNEDNFEFARRTIFECNRNCTIIAPVGLETDRTLLETEEVKYKRLEVTPVCILNIEGSWRETRWGPMVPWNWT